MKLGDMELEIHKTWYNKTKVQEDGITHIVDPTPYTAYQFCLAKNYFDIENRRDVIKAIMQDLQQTIKDLQQLLDKENDLER